MSNAEKVLATLWSDGWLLSPEEIASTTGLPEIDVFSAILDLGYKVIHDKDFEERSTFRVDPLAFDRLVETEEVLIFPDGRYAVNHPAHGFIPRGKLTDAQKKDIVNAWK
jgi:hypothetical protein